MSRMPDYCNESTYAQTRLPVTLASTLLPDAYRSHDFYASEKERLWSTSWICVGYTQQLDKVGDTFIARVNDDSLIVTRSDPYTIRAFHNVCRHRGSKLLTECGSHSFFRCPYHAWGYDLDGKLKGAPYFQDDEITLVETEIYRQSGGQIFDKANYGLLPAKVTVWGCFIFINLDNNCEPLELQLGDIRERVRNYPLTDLVMTHSVKYQIEANWKLVAENYMEYYHLPWVHPSLNRVSHHHNHHRFQGDGMYYGMTTCPLEKDPDVPVEGELPSIPGLNEEEKESARWLWVFPNVAISLLPYYMTVMLLTPDSHGRTLETFDFFFHPSAQQDPNFNHRSEAVYNFWGKVNLEDIAIVERVQEGISNKAYQGGRMCFRFEDSIHRFQNHVIDKMVGS
ncbi:MAG: Rieske 2Fe-2S domain-containing protein [Nitrospiraceae bacterium]|nr:Rieske 2Fe-2S domain-containing protein [Nitrospiraceae bacterium]MCI0590280.1 Rieske 2Fe-2S domain-containing protein [Gammaproteobacteria bacterium]